MGLFDWIREHIVEPVQDFFSPSDSHESDTHEPPDFDSPEPAGGQSTPSDSELPPGWVIAGLYHQGEQTPRIHATDVTQVTDSEIHRADAVVVWFVAAGDDGYRWIHGATGWRSVADQIDRVITVVSPTAE